MEILSLFLGMLGIPQNTWAVSYTIATDRKADLGNGLIMSFPMSHSGLRFSSEKECRAFVEARWMEPMTTNVSCQRLLIKWPNTPQSVCIEQEEILNWSRRPPTTTERHAP